MPDSSDLFLLASYFDPFSPNRTPFSIFLLFFFSPHHLILAGNFSKIFEHEMKLISFRQYVFQKSKIHKNIATYCTVPNEKFLFILFFCIYVFYKKFDINNLFKCSTQFVIKCSHIL